MKKILFILLICSLFLTFPTVTVAHSGRTDSKGGHYNHATGDYHYHHGYPAHEHTNGNCPYKQNISSETKEENTDTHNEKTNNKNSLGFFSYIFSALICLICGAFGAMIPIVILGYLGTLILMLTGLFEKFGEKFHKIYFWGLVVLWVIVALVMSSYAFNSWILVS